MAKRVLMLIDDDILIDVKELVVNAPNDVKAIIVQVVRPQKRSTYNSHFGNRSIPPIV